MSLATRWELGSGGEVFVIPVVALSDPAAEVIPEYLLGLAGLWRQNVSDLVICEHFVHGVVFLRQLNNVVVIVGITVAVDGCKDPLKK
jgi:hypothetical protein